MKYKRENRANFNDKNKPLDLKLRKHQSRYFIHNICLNPWLNLRFNILCLCTNLLSFWFTTSILKSIMNIFFPGIWLCNDTWETICTISNLLGLLFPSLNIHWRISTIGIQHCLPWFNNHKIWRMIDNIDVNIELYSWRVNYM